MMSSESRGEKLVQCRVDGMENTPCHGICGVSKERVGRTRDKKIKSFCIPFHEEPRIKEEMNAVGLENITIPGCVNVHDWMIPKLEKIYKMDLTEINDKVEIVIKSPSLYSFENHENSSADFMKMCVCDTYNCNNEDLLKTPSSITILPCKGRKPCLR